MPLRAVARVSVGAIERNCRRLLDVAGTPLCAVVKADGYGHGAAEAARAARRGGGGMLAGVMTHFATSDDDPSFAREQLGRFLPFVAAVRELHPGVIAHAANSAAAIGIPDSRLDLVRCGIATYGLDPFQRDPADHG